MALNGWEHHELSIELSESSIYQLLNIYKREDDNYKKRCHELFVNKKKYSEEGIKEIEKELELQHERCIIVSLKIADKLTKDEL